MADESPHFHHLQKIALEDDAHGPLQRIIQGLTHRKWIELGGGMRTVESLEGLEDNIRAVAEACKIQGVGTIVRYERDGIVPVKRPTVVILLEFSNEGMTPRISNEEFGYGLAVYIDKMERITSGVTLLVFRMNDSVDGSSTGRSEHHRIIRVP